MLAFWVNVRTIFLERCVTASLVLTTHLEGSRLFLQLRQVYLPPPLKR